MFVDHKSYQRIAWFILSLVPFEVICICYDQGLSPELEPGSPKLVIVKFVVVLFSIETNRTTISMYLSMK